MFTHATFNCQGCDRELQAEVESLPIDGPCPICGVFNRVEPPSAAPDLVPNPSSTKSAPKGARRFSALVALTLAIAIGGGACVFIGRKLRKNVASRPAAADSTSESVSLPTQSKDGVVVVRMEESGDPLP